MFWECKNSFIKCQYRFWHQYEQTSNPNDKTAKALLKVVQRHLTPPPSSTNVERLFSYEGLVATDHRSSLSGEKLDQILFLRENALMANFNLGWLWEGYLSTSMYIFSYCVTYKYINWLELCIEYWIWILYFNKLLNQWDKRSFSIHQTWGTSSVNLHSYPYYKYYFRKFFSMKLITGSDFNNAGISCKENLDLWIVLFAHGELISLSLNPFNDSLDAVLHRFKNQKKIISDNKKSLKWLSDKHACILWSMNSGQEDIAVLFQRASCI